MKHRLAAILLCFGVVMTLFGCNRSPASPGALNGKQTEYSDTIAYATTAWGGVEITESSTGHTLKNKTAALDFGISNGELNALTSLQTGETLLKDTFVTYLTAADGRTAVIEGGSDTVESGFYGIGHHRTDADVRIPGNVQNAEILKEFDLTEDGTPSKFTALSNDVTEDSTATGLTITSQGKNRSQFGGRYLGIDLGEHDHYYLSLTLRADAVSGLKCFFATDTVPLTEGTGLGTISIPETGEEFVTLTAEISNPHWNGTLQTLLFRFPEGETGSVELSRIAVLTLDDDSDRGIANTLWTVYSDRIYFSQTLSFAETEYTACATVISINEAKCRELIESENAVALKMIDGSILGFVRPTRGGTLRTERDEQEIRLIFEWDLGAETPTFALRVYLNYTDTTEELEKIAQQERSPLTADDFILEGAEFERYDPKGGIYRLKRTGEQVSVTVKKNDRTIYFHLLPADGTAWKVCDENGDRLPVFAGATFPVCANRQKLTFRLMPERALETISPPEFFAASGLTELSRGTTALNGLCTQNTTVYAASDGSYTATLTTTALTDGKGTIYDITYAFHAPTLVSDVRNAFPFFSFELTYGFDEYFYRNAENQTVTRPAGEENVSYLGDMPYLGLSNDSESAGWLVTKSEMTCGGEKSTANLCLRYTEVSEDEPNRLYLSFDQGETEFIRGDTLTAQVIRMGGETVEESALKTLRDGGNYRLIQTEHKSVGTFTAMGMEETVIVRIEGFDHYLFPEITANGEKFTPEYHVYVDQNGYYGFAFSVKKGTEISIKNK